MLGAGPQKEELEEWFVTDTVAFASADVFIMLSDSETLDFVVLESMASSVPVAGAAAGGIPDLIDDETCIGLALAVLLIFLYILPIFKINCYNSFCAIGICNNYHISATVGIVVVNTIFRF
jgi:hypothetical protein